MRPFLVFVALVLAVSGCSSKSKEGEARRAEAEAAQAEAEAPPAPKGPPRMFDVEGRLIPSGEYIAGIPLPVGAELFRADELTHVYRIRAPIKRVLAYFGPLMITGKVERRGKGAVYRRASVRGAEVNPTKVDVAIFEIGGNLVRISVTELRPPPAYVPSSAQTKAAARESWRMLD